nr:MAG TPA: Porphobilinogen deaminase, C-terminal domain [Caudoviricetes sp.]
MPRYSPFICPCSGLARLDGSCTTPTHKAATRAF